MAWNLCTQSCREHTLIITNNVVLTNLNTKRILFILNKKYVLLNSKGIILHYTISIILL